MSSTTRHKDREKDRELERAKERDRDLDRDKDKERRKEERPHRHRRSSHSHSHRKSSDRSGRSTATPEPSTPISGSSKHRRDMTSDRHRRPSSVASPSISKVSLPYPPFSKTHSKESLGKEPVLRKRLYPQNPAETPPQSKHPAESSERLRDSNQQTAESGTNGILNGRVVPPSPPPTPSRQHRKKSHLGATSKMAEELRQPLDEGVEMPRMDKEQDGEGSQVTLDVRPRSRRSKQSLNREDHSSSRERAKKAKASVQGESQLSASKESRSNSKSTTPIPKAKNIQPNPLDRVKAASPDPHSANTSTVDSDATSLARNHDPSYQQPPPLTDAYESSLSHEDSSPRTPTVGTPSFPPPPPPIGHDKKSIASPVMIVGGRDQQYVTSNDSPRPPPPPPPPTMPLNIPRVDYLLQNGGLPHIVPRTLLSVSMPSPPLQEIQQQQPGSKLQGPTPPEVEKIFEPYHKRLDEFQKILSRNGSLAVATGYRSVARRLLDRLESVFARDISSESCYCVMCQKVNSENVDGAEIMGKGVGWGEILEWVSGRRDLPTWPAFDFSNLLDPIKKDSSDDAEDVAGAMGLGIIGRSDSPLQKRRLSAAQRPTSPLQRIDADVPEEYRSHYIRQSKKTKELVNNWLSSCPEKPSSPPKDIDDETLVFAILTHLDPAERVVFNALISSPPSGGIPGSRVPTPLKKLRSELIVKTGLALQRLYRLLSPPRDAEIAIFLLRHPKLHGVLATLSIITTSEWDVLTSGRFDGFLWSGAESEVNFSAMPSASPSPAPFSTGPSRGPTPMSRGPTPFSSMQPSRGPTPFSQGQLSRGPTPFSVTQSRSPMALSPDPSRMATPFYAAASAASRGITPAPGALGCPVPLDEETEIAVLAEVEREIYVGMEALEDAFEALHRKAEFVRRALRERGAGLSLANQARRNTGSGGWGSLLGGGVEVMTGTPGMGYGWESEVETDDGIDDNQSELMPDDSASNISSNRHRRPKRRNERRTPAPVEEESEEDSHAG